MAVAKEQIRQIISENNISFDFLNTMFVFVRIRIEHIA